VHTARADRRRGRRSRRGFVLPFVVVATALVGVLLLAAVTTQWRGYRAARLAANGERAQFAAEEGVALLLDGWPTDSLAATTLGATLSTRVTTALGDSVRVRITRTHPLIAWVTADAALDANGTRGLVRRHVTRVLALEPPALPLRGAVTALSAVYGTDPSRVDGRDIVDASDACGPLRDTLSAPPVASTALHASPSGSWSQQPAWESLGDTAMVRAQFDHAWVSLVARSTVRSPTSWPQLLSASSGWQSLLLDGATVSLQSPSRWRGVLAIAGDLRVTGSLEIDGVLVVRGRLDARGAQLRIRGALVVASLGNPGVELGDQSHVRFDRCAIQMALATIAVPRAQPFSLWYAAQH
jgi:hypothetical protein